MSEIAIGLPNQALKPLLSTFQPSPLETIPFEKHAETGVLAAATETNVFPGGAIATTFPIPANKKVTIEDILVKSSVVDDAIFRVYRNGVQVLQYEVEAADKTERIPTGIELDENETLRVTVTSAAGGGIGVLDLRGREVLKRNELFSQVIA